MSSEERVVVGTWCLEGQTALRPTRLQSEPGLLSFGARSVDAYSPPR